MIISNTPRLWVISRNQKAWIHLLCMYLYKEQSPGETIQHLRMWDPSYMRCQPCHVYTGSSFWLGPCQWPMKWEHTSVVVRITSRMQRDSKKQLRSILNTVSHARNKNVWNSNPNYWIWWEDSLGPTPCFPWVPNSCSVFILTLGLCVHNIK